MKIILYVTILLFTSLGFGQDYANKEYYLIDSLVLNELDTLDRQLLESSLTIFHSSKNDTSKVNALVGICDNMMHDCWMKYQSVQLGIIHKILDSSPSPVVKRKMMIAKGVVKFLVDIYDQEGEIVGLATILTMVRKLDQSK